MLKSFLNKYDTIIFDMDGVITSEQNYWNSAALTINEYLNKYHGITTNPIEAMENLQYIRSEIFLEDKLITLLKSKGVNSNWDLGYVIVCISLILSTRDANRIYEYAKKLADNILEEYESLATELAKTMGCGKEQTRRNGPIWMELHDCFQEWFLGDELFIKTYTKTPKLNSKKGLVYDEKPIIDLEVLKDILKELSKTKRICMGTGRPSAEIIEPLKKWDCLRYFAEDGLITYDNVVNAEKQLNMNTLTKPHPYMFLKGMLGKGYSDIDIVNGKYDKNQISNTLIVGDAGSDIIAAKAMNADFCAVLTGIAGKDGRGYFEKMKSEYILDSIRDFLEKC